MEVRLLRAAIISLSCLCLSFSLSPVVSSSRLLLPRSEVDAATQESAAYGVLKRLLPTHKSAFEFHVISEVNKLIASSISSVITVY
jgi:hypothetical protein